MIDSRVWRQDIPQAVQEWRDMVFWPFTVHGDIVKRSTMPQRMVMIILGMKEMKYMN